MSLFLGSLNVWFYFHFRVWSFRRSSSNVLRTIWLEKCSEIDAPASHSRRPKMGGWGERLRILQNLYMKTHKFLPLTWHALCRPSVHCVWRVECCLGVWRVGVLRKLGIKIFRGTRGVPSDWVLATPLSSFQDRPFSFPSPEASTCFWRPCCPLL